MNDMKVLIVDDSAFMRKMITDFLHGFRGIEVAGTAKNGSEALEQIKKLSPDVITMDVEMPVMDGMAALKKIMENDPRPVIMLSSTTQKGAEETITALENGAVDFVAKPSGAISLDLYKVRDELREKVLQTAFAKIIGPEDREKHKDFPRSLEKYSKICTVREKNPVFNSGIRHFRPVICIGTSTGGPRALQRVLPMLPSKLDAPVFIVQHMPQGFTASLSERLDKLCKIRVKEAADGERAEAGTAYIAPGGSHLTVIQKGTSLYVKVERSAIRNGHRPSVDVLFESISQTEGFRHIAVIMTGMGSDGTKGLSLLKQKGNTYSIAESEQTSVVFGMPKSAIGEKLVDSIDHVDHIAEKIMHYMQS
ncbi:chemotaxis response regulator protein-glutamate methylesterase [Bacillus sp. FJAT-42376]|uniref:protein-glutamate methylesterase/protein-glutamine glutaminase n=1 Tax=Bacillus sp. FJAT-42376 TaxID=2014076 RepID=UPI000F510611|nr:chemotaxis response regulator protein-glutamate methylesterase [Bacillus sp. FJAT-42376]AZB44841.1 chemotaxis response regulator protein-glutamate methylesterase [Bacillus sp. FJAT-42376]